MAPLFLLLAYLMVACLLLAPVQDISVVKWFVIRAVAPILLGGWLLWRGELAWRWDPIAVLALLFLGTHIISLVHAVNPGYTYTKISAFIGLLATYFLVVLVVRDTVDRDRVVWTLVLIGTFSAAYGIAQHFGYDFFPWRENREVPVSRGVSFFGHATFTASVLAQAIPLALAMVVASRRWAGRVAAAIAAAAMLYHLSFSGARMATLSLIAAFAAGAIAGLALWLRNREGGLRALVTWPRAAAAIVLVVAGSVAAGWFVARAWSVKGSDVLAIRQASFALRLYTWETSSRMVFAHPWTGIGAGNYEVVAPAYWNDVEQMWAARFGRWMHEAHNEYLETAVEQGLPGVLVLLALFAYAVVMSLNLAANAPDPRTRRLGLGLFASVVAIALDANATYSLQAPGSALVLWVVLGVISWSHLRLRDTQMAA